MRELNLIAANIRLKSANGNNISAGESPFTCSLKLRDKLLLYTLIINQIEISCILGADFLSKDACNIKEKVVRVKGVRHPLFRGQSG